MNRFVNQVAFVTGAASGIGLATARRLAKEGASVFACDVNAELLGEEVAALKSAGLNVVGHVFNVADVSACRDAMEAAIDHYGRLDILANIAGILISKHFTDLDDADWSRIMAINFHGPVALCKAAVPHLLASRGAIINVASTAALVGQAYNSAYCASKAALLQFTKAIAVEYSRKGLRINAVCPGGVNTALARGASFPEDLDAGLLGLLMPLRPDIAEPEEIAGAIAYLASDEARFCVGTALVIDGGQTTA